MTEIYQQAGFNTAGFEVTENLRNVFLHEDANGFQFNHKAIIHQ